jgi:hypothetical protein
MQTTANHPLNPRVIGQTESALGALLGPVLADTGTSFEQWVVLAVIVDGGPADRTELVARIHEVTSGLFDFPAEDLATGRVLNAVTARANAFLAAHAVR